MDVNDFYEDDEPAAEVWAQFDAAEKGVTAALTLPASLFLHTGTGGAGFVSDHERHVDAPLLPVAQSLLASANRAAS